MNDLINGCFELCGGLLLLLNVWRLWIDRAISGVSMLPVCFYTLWGFWNLYFYPSVGARWSFWGGIIVVLANSLWLGLYLTLTRNRKLRK